MSKNNNRKITVAFTLDELDYLADVMTFSAMRYPGNDSILNLSIARAVIASVRLAQSRGL